MTEHTSSSRRIVVVGPHPDDQEAGMGGTIAKLISQGHHVLLLDVTDGEPTPYGDPVTRAQETEAATKILDQGTGLLTRRMVGLPNRTVEHTVEARHAIASVFREFQAEIIFTPFFEDAHPDHRAVTRIVEDARFDAKLTKTDMPGKPIYPKWLFYYYATHLRWVANPKFCIDVTGFEQIRLDAVRAYHSQFVLPERNRKAVTWIEAQMTYYGSRIGTPAAEPFYTKEPIALNGLNGLI